MNFIFTKILIILIFSTSLCFCTLGKKSFSFEKTQEQVKSQICKRFIKAEEFSLKNNILTIKIYNDFPDTFKKQKEEAFKVMKPFLKQGILKAQVLWQKDKYSFGKLALISNVYISALFEKKITQKVFINSIDLSLIEPQNIFKNNIIKSSKKVFVSKEQVLHSAKLRNYADIYRNSKNYDSAIRVYLDTLNLNPNDNIALFWIAEIYKEKGFYKLAEDCYLRALGLEPGFRAADNSLFELRQKYLHKM